MRDKNALRRLGNVNRRAEEIFREVVITVFFVVHFATTENAFIAGLDGLYGFDFQRRNFGAVAQGKALTVSEQNAAENIRAQVQNARLRNALSIRHAPGAAAAGIQQTAFRKEISAIQFVIVGAAGQGQFQTGAQRLLDLSVNANLIQFDIAFLIEQISVLAVGNIALELRAGNHRETAPGIVVLRFRIPAPGVVFEISFAIDRHARG